MYNNHASYVITYLTRRFAEERQAERMAVDIKIALEVIKREFPEAENELQERHRITHAY